MATKKKFHTIRNAYDAYWFLYEHPKFSIPERFECTPEEADKYEAEGWKVWRDTGGKCYRLFLHSPKRAMHHRLDIFYAKTDGKRVSDNEKENKHIECWLEFGQIRWAYSWSCTEKPMAEWDNETTQITEHDTRLDCGGATFDEALVKLAKKVMKYYGDFNPDDMPERKVCKGRGCAECRARKEAVKKLGL